MKANGMVEVASMVKVGVLQGNGRQKERYNGGRRQRNVSKVGNKRVQNGVQWGR